MRDFVTNKGDREKSQLVGTHTHTHNEPQSRHTQTDQRKIINHSSIECAYTTPNRRDSQLETCVNVRVTCLVDLDGARSQLTILYLRRHVLSYESRCNRELCKKKGIPFDYILCRVMYKLCEM